MTRFEFNSDRFICPCSPILYGVWTLRLHPLRFGGSSQWLLMSSSLNKLSVPHLIGNVGDWLRLLDPHHAGLAVGMNWLSPTGKYRHFQHPHTVIFKYHAVAGRCRHRSVQVIGNRLRTDRRGKRRTRDHCHRRKRQDCSRPNAHRAMMAHHIAAANGPRMAGSFACGGNRNHTTVALC